MTAIRFEHISKTYDKAPIPSVVDVSLEVEDGSFVALLGPSGCGKTTLLKMVNRLLEPTAGTIYMDGVDIREMSLTALRRKIGYVIQQIGLFPHMTVAKNIAVVPELLGWDQAEIDVRVHHTGAQYFRQPASACSTILLELPQPVRGNGIAHGLGDFVQACGFGSGNEPYTLVIAVGCNTAFLDTKPPGILVCDGEAH